MSNHKSSKLAAIGAHVRDLTVVSMMGRGRYSSVWQASDGTQDVALKIYATGSDYIDDYANEVKILSIIGASGPIAREYISIHTRAFVEVTVDDAFSVCIYPCIIFDCAGVDASALAREYEGVLPYTLAKKIMVNVLRGLEHLHSIDIIHADIKPENIIVDMPRGHARLCDFGSSSLRNDIYSNYVGTQAYLAPELIFSADFDTPADMWAAGATFFELATGFILFDVYNVSGITYGGGVDGALLLPSDADTSADADADTDANAGSSSSSKYESSTEDSAGENAVINRHLLLLSALLGAAPACVTKLGAQYYNASGGLLAHTCARVGISANTNITSSIPAPICADLIDFLEKVIIYEPADRLTATAALLHPLAAAAH